MPSPWVSTTSSRPGGPICQPMSCSTTVIACGGAGRPQDLRQVLAFDEVSAAAAANFFHFAEHSVAVVKSQLMNAGFDVRLDSQADYRAHPTDADGRLRRLPDPELLDQYFEFIEEEVI